MGNMEKRWVYKMVSGADCKLNIRPSGSTPIFNGNMMVGAKKTPAINLRFNRGICVVDEVLARRSPIVDSNRSWESQRDDVFDALITMIEGQSCFGSALICIQSPEKSLTKEDIAKIEKLEEEKRKARAKVIHDEKV